MSLTSSFFSIFGLYGIIGLVIAVIAILYVIIHRRKIARFADSIERSKMEDDQKARRLAAEAERHRQEESDRKQKELESSGYTSEVVIPRVYKNLQLAYHYDDVKLNTSGVSPSRIVPGKPLTLKDKGDTIDAYQGDLLLLGSLPQNRLSEMVRDWDKNGDPYLAYVAKCSPDGNDIEIALAFYMDNLARFLSRNPEAKRIKLAGKPEDFVTAYAGAECNVDYDIEKDKYLVMLDGGIIGVLPASALKYASEHDTDPEDLTIYVADTEYDSDKDRDIIYVYIAD